VRVAIAMLVTACRFDFDERVATPRDASADATPPCSAVGFVAAPSPAVAMGPRDLVLADVDRDGKLDALVAAESGSLDVLIGNGDGTFAPRVGYPGDMHNWSIAVGDLDGNGSPDIAIGNFDASTESVYLNHGDGTFAAKVDYPTGTNPQSSAVGDVNGDHVLDIVTASYTVNTVSILLGNGNGTFQAPNSFATGPGPYSVAIGDLDGDGAADLVVADQGGCGGCNGNLVSVLHGGGTGAFPAKVDYPTGPAATQPWHIAIADLDRDGKPDLAVANNYGAMPSTQTIAVFRNAGNGLFPTRIDTPSGAFPWWVSVADFDADGNPDLIVAGGSDNVVSLLLGNGDGTFRPRQDFPAANKPSSVAVGDLDGDGRPDIVTADNTSSMLSVLTLTCTP
jgi:hypothetical protein